MIKAVIFDVDVTLIDSVDLHAAAWVEALSDAAFGDVRSQIGKGGDQLLPVFVSAERLAQEEQKISDFRSDLFKRQYLPRVRAFPGVPALFQRIRLDGLKVALASSGKADEVDDYARIAGVTELIDLATTADDAERSKPEPDIFEAALARLAPISAAESIVIGDTPWDVIAANKAACERSGCCAAVFRRTNSARQGNRDLQGSRRPLHPL
jgi:beta-phosphoglucomutase-like phosphatase (HAD superfamily)